MLIHRDNLTYYVDKERWLFFLRLSSSEEVLFYLNIEWKLLFWWRKLMTDSKSDVRSTLFPTVGRRGNVENQSPSNYERFWMIVTALSGQILFLFTIFMEIAMSTCFGFNQNTFYPWFCIEPELLSSCIYLLRQAWKSHIMFWKIMIN